MIRLFTIGYILLTCAVQAGEYGPAWTRHTIDNTSQGADGVRLADVNKDGMPDIVTPWEEGGVIRIYMNPGCCQSKKPWPAVTVGQAPSPEDAILIDLDEDGALDVVTSCEGKTKAMYVHWAPTQRDKYLDADAWELAPIPASQTGMQWMFSLPFTQGDTDMIIAGAKGQHAHLGWFSIPLDPRNMAAWQWHPICSVGWIMSIQRVDVDSDGDADVLFTDRKGRKRGCYWLDNPGDDIMPPDQWEMHTIARANDEYMFLNTGDLDKDGQLDIICGLKDHMLLHWKPGKDVRDKWLESRIPMPGDTGTAKGVALGDIDLNDTTDLVFTCENSLGKHGVMYMTRKPNGTWGAHAISGQEGTKFDRIELLDLDGDTDLDLLTCEEKEGLGVIWYENPSR